MFAISRHVVDRALTPVSTSAKKNSQRAHRPIGGISRKGYNPSARRQIHQRIGRTTVARGAN
jgi:hypothetical protein